MGHPQFVRGQSGEALRTGGAPARRSFDVRHAELLYLMCAALAGPRFASVAFRHAILRCTCLIGPAVGDIFEPFARPGFGLTVRGRFPSEVTVEPTSGASYHAAEVDDCPGFNVLVQRPGRRNLGGAR